MRMATIPKFIRRPAMLLWAAWAWLGLGQNLQANNVTFCYHQFNYSLGQLYAVLPEVFAWQVRYIQSQNLPLLSLEEMTRLYATGQADIGKNVFLTVDDGCKNFNLILPQVVKNKIPMTLFIYPAAINRGPEYFSNTDLETLRAIPSITFGCHSYSHIMLRHCQAPVLEREMVSSQSALQNILGVPVQTFAYPFGMYDRASKDLARKHYQLAFGVNDGSNTGSTSRHALNRYVVYKTTTFGEFMDWVDHAQGKDRPRACSVISLEEGQGRDRYFIYTKVKLYAYPAENKKQALLIIPSSHLGCGWAYKLIPACAQKQTAVYAMVSRNNNLPFYRPVKEMRNLVGWGLAEYLSDLRHTLDYLAEHEEKISVATWGDGLDWLLAFLAAEPRYQKFIQKIIVANPSLPNPPKTWDGFQSGRDECQEELEQGEYASPKLSFYLKIKTLADLMILAPDERSPFARCLGREVKSNAQLFLEILNQENHPVLGLPAQPDKALLADFSKAHMQPLPAYSMVVPLVWQRDLYDVWLHRFESPALGITHREELQSKVACCFSGNFSGNPALIKQTFPNLKLQEKPLPGNPSTVEILLSDAWTQAVLEEMKP